VEAPPPAPPPPEAAPPPAKTPETIPAVSRSGNKIDIDLFIQNLQKILNL
jgi:hypothetical protein